MKDNVAIVARYITRELLNQSRLLSYIEAFPSLSIGVVGDIIADEYLYGKTNRVSREAPVLVIKRVRRTFVPGGASNTANNLRALGIDVPFVGVLGKDIPGQEMARVFEEQGIGTDHVLSLNDHLTTTKTRILAGGQQTTFQQVVRIDAEEPLHIGHEAEQHLAEATKAVFANSNAVIVSDYGLGVVSPALVDLVNKLLTSSDAPIVTVDSREKLRSFRNITAATPNQAEVELLVGHSIDSEAELVTAGTSIRADLSADQLLITRGNQGMALFSSEPQPALVPIYGGDQVADVTGAGDTVIATYTAALAAGATGIEAMVLSNIAGGISVMKVGTATVSQEELADGMARYFR